MTLRLLVLVLAASLTLVSCSPAGLATVGVVVGIGAEATGGTESLINAYLALKGKRISSVMAAASKVCVPAGSEP